MTQEVELEIDLLRRHRVSGRDIKDGGLREGRLALQDSYGANDAQREYDHSSL
jgi:hypothetical protein